MSLATRCTSCGTAFRVVQDQLKVSEGWVRCGQCREVFSAFEQLFDLERDSSEAPPAHPVPGSEPLTAADTEVDARPAAAEPAAEVIEIDVAGAVSKSTREAVESAPLLPPPEDIWASPEAATADREDAGPPTIYAALDEPSMMEAVATAVPIDAPAPTQPATQAAHPHAERSAPSDAAPLPLELDSRDDDESPLLPPLETEAHQDKGSSDAPFLAPELASEVDADDTIRLPDASSQSTATAPAREPDVAVDEWAAEAAHERPSLIEKEIDAHLFGKRRHARRHAPVAHVSARDQLDFSDARFDSNLLTDDDALEGDATPSERAGLPLETTLPAATPEFLRRAERQSRWQQPAMRSSLWVGCIGLAVLLVWQAVHHFRDDAAAHWPAMKPLLAAWCGVASCTLGAPRHIEDITIENHALARASGDAFRLAVTLRNHAAVPLALPAVELSLTDALNVPVARRDLSARDFKLSPPVLPPNGELTLEAPIAARNARVSGYTVEIFYP